MSQQVASASRSLAATLLLAAAAAAATAQAPTPGAACHNDLVALRSACYEYVQQGSRPGGGALVPPSPNCCATVKAVRDVPCICDYLATDFNIDLGRVFYVAGQCGAAIPSSCGY